MIHLRVLKQEKSSFFCILDFMSRIIFMLSLVEQEKSFINSGFELCTQWKAKDSWFLHADSDNSDQTREFPRLTQVFPWKYKLFCFCQALAFNPYKPCILLIGHRQTVYLVTELT